MSFESITIQATVDSPLETTWACYTEPQHIIGWNFASDTWCCPSAENDLTVGGQYRARMEAKDGSMGFDFEGTYSAVEPKQKLSYGLADGRQVTVTFTQHQRATLVTTVFDAETENPIALQREGWQAILDNFKRYAEENS